MGLTIDELDNLSTGMVYDMLVEKLNDAEEYEVLADQSDFDKF